ncbi:MAG TPA: CoA transferase [Candidatus Binatus sp.]|uniref:CaiB/BaiF CoA transferase family protein n=1 Tax=Candidatus Binatus sp. TaxID=2811406 RepID=UPI002B486A7B|nr:CoA transferase [Candidatus Binatus sp.]HKN13516.1 CoA transferase [Candidatus Binatus sp.]
MNTIFDGKLRVLDISMGWAGALVGQMFAEMGAEVLKVEDTHHFDWWRGSLSMAPPEMQPIERAAVFNTANRGKRGVTLDLASARGIEILKRLIEVSDVLVENFSPGVMDRRGLGYEAVSAINPRLIMISMPSFGSDGPECNARGYGNTVEAMAGVTGLTGYHDGDGQRYTLSNALGDPVGGLHGVFALMVALYERERSGRGQLIELAQVESLIPFVAEAIVDFQFTEKVPAARGNRHREYAPHGIYRCAGDDNWIALACETGDQWRSLASALGVEQLASDKRFASASDRKANEDALDAELSRAIAPLNADDCAERLRDAGVLAAPVNSASAVMADPQIQSREYFVAIDRAVVGTHLYPGAVARIPDTPLRADTPAPLLGEHNRQVFAELLGMNDDDIAELERSGVIGSSPRQYRAAS